MNHEERTLQVVPGKTDAEVAADLRKRLEEAAREMSSVMDECVRAGFVPSFQFGVGLGGRHALLNLILSKQF